MARTECLPWNSTGTVGKRLYVLLEGKFTDNRVRNVRTWKWNKSSHAVRCRRYNFI